MWWRSLMRLLTAFVLAGVVLVPSATRPPSAVAAEPCPAGPVTVRDLIRLARDRGPILDRHAGLGAISVSPRAAACFGPRTLRVTAFVANGIIGDVTPWSLKPTWMVDPGMLLFPVRRLANQGDVGRGPFLMVATPPSLGDVQGRYRNRWVVVTGRYDDPVASSCRPTGLLRVAPSREEAIRICRGIFVVSSVSLMGAPATVTIPADLPDTATESAEDQGAGPVEAGYAAGWLALSAVLGVLLAAWLAERLRRVQVISRNEAA
jgi:hypothetical protein